MTKNDLSISARLLYEAAIDREIECYILSEHLLRMQYRDKWWYTCGSRTSLQSSVGKTIADFKHLSKRVFEYHSIPTAKAVIVSKLSEIERIEQLQYPLVMKPSFGNQGTDVVVGITSIEEAKQHLKRLTPSSEYPVLFEELLIGEEYRIVCIGHQFVTASHREPAHVVGDGNHSIADLIKIKNKHPWRGSNHRTPLSYITTDELVIAYLDKQNLTLSSVPQPQQKIYLRKTANLSTGGEAKNVSSSVSASNIELFEKIARVCDLNIIGIDIKCQSLDIPLTEQYQAGVLEVNTSPGLRMHHYPMQGEPVDIAGLILDYVQDNYEALQAC